MQRSEQTRPDGSHKLLPDVETLSEQRSPRPAPFMHRYRPQPAVQPGRVVAARNSRSRSLDGATKWENAVQLGGCLPPLRESPTLDRRIGKARQDAVIPVRHIRCSVIYLLSLQMLRCCLWIAGYHPNGDVWLVHRVCMAADLFTLLLTVPIAWTGIERLLIRSGIMGMAMCLVLSMFALDSLGLAMFTFCVAPVLALQVGEPLFWHALVQLIDTWACMLLISILLQAVIGVSCWRIYREMRVQQLYPANTSEIVHRDQVEELEILCEPEDVAKCRAECNRTPGCTGHSVECTAIPLQQNSEPPEIALDASHNENENKYAGIAGYEELVVSSNDCGSLRYPSPHYPPGIAVPSESHFDGIENAVFLSQLQQQCHQGLPNREAISVDFFKEHTSESL